MRELIRIRFRVGSLHRVALFQQWRLQMVNLCDFVFFIVIVSDVVDL